MGRWEWLLEPLGVVWPLYYILVQNKQSIFFLYPELVHSFDPIWGKCDDQQLVKTLAFLWKELRLEKKKWTCGSDGKDVNKVRNALCADSIAQFIDIFPASAIRS